MNIKKILKFYLVLTLMVTGISLLSYSDMIKNYASNYYTSTLKALDGVFDDSGYKYSKENQYNATKINEVSDGKIRQNWKNKNSITDYNFSISNDSNKAHALPGARMAEIMQINFKTKDQPLEIKSLKLKIEGVADENIEAAYLFAGDEIIKNSKPEDGYLIFGDIDYEIDVNKTFNFVIKLDLGQNLKPGDRIRLDIEDEESIDIKVGNKKSILTETFSIKGKYLTIAVPRYIKEALKN